MLPPDNHVHSEWSYDTGSSASMIAACQRAADAGVPAVAFTEHLDFTDWGPGDAGGGTGVKPGWWDAIRPLDVTGYLASVAECRQRFAGLRILTGVEAGELHLFAGSAGGVLASAQFDRVLGSLHSLSDEGRLVGVARLLWSDAPGTMRRYLAELVDMIESSDVFQVLAHCDFPRRYWPGGAHTYVAIKSAANHNCVIALRVPYREPALRCAKTHAN